MHQFALCAGSKAKGPDGNVPSGPSRNGWGLTRQAHKHVLHVVVVVDGPQKGFDFFELFGAQVGRVDWVLGFVAQLGRHHGEAVFGQGAADQVQVGGFGDEHRHAVFVGGLKVLRARFDGGQFGVSARLGGLY